MNTEGPGSPAVPGPLPADVVIARSIKAHTRALLVVLAAPVVLAGLGVAALSLAGEHGQAPPAVAGVTMIAQGQVLGVVAAILIGRGMYSLLSSADIPGSASSRQVVAEGLPVRVLRRTIANLA